MFLRYKETLTLLKPLCLCYYWQPAKESKLSIRRSKQLIFLTSIIMKPQKQMIKVFHRSCSNAINENRVSISFDKVIIFRCLWMRSRSTIKDVPSLSLVCTSIMACRMMSTWPPTWSICKYKTMTLSKLIKKLVL